MTSLLALAASFGFLLLACGVLARAVLDRGRYRRWKARGCHDPEISGAPMRWIRRLEWEGFD